MECPFPKLANEINDASKEEFFRLMNILGMPIAGKPDSDVWKDYCKSYLEFKKEDMKEIKSTERINSITENQKLYLQEEEMGKQGNDVFVFIEKRSKNSPLQEISFVFKHQFEKHIAKGPIEQYTGFYNKYVDTIVGCDILLGLFPTFVAMRKTVDMIFWLFHYPLCTVLKHLFNEDNKTVAKIHIFRELHETLRDKVFDQRITQENYEILRRILSCILYDCYKHFIKWFFEDGEFYKRVLNDVYSFQKFPLPKPPTYLKKAEKKVETTTKTKKKKTKKPSLPKSPITKNKIDIDAVVIDYLKRQCEVLWNSMKNDRDGAFMCEHLDNINIYISAKTLLPDGTDIYPAYSSTRVIREGPALFPSTNASRKFVSAQTGRDIKMKEVKGYEDETSFVNIKNERVPVLKRTLPFFDTECEDEDDDEESNGEEEESLCSEIESAQEEKPTSFEFPPDCVISDQLRSYYWEHYQIQKHD